MAKPHHKPIENRVKFPSHGRTNQDTGFVRLIIKTQIFTFSCCTIMYYCIFTLKRNTLTNTLMVHFMPIESQFWKPLKGPSVDIRTYLVWRIIYFFWQVQSSPNKAKKRYFVNPMKSMSRILMSNSFDMGYIKMFFKKYSMYR